MGTENGKMRYASIEWVGIDAPTGST
jgi:hypothetical protein